MSSGNEAESIMRGIEVEYTTLRAEILKRIEMRQQIISITLTLAGIFLSVGISVESVALIYPILAAFLAVGWSQNDFRVRDTATYIRNNLESRLPGLGYETYVQDKRERGTGLSAWRFVVFSHGGVFLVTQLLAIGLELAKFTPSPIEWVLVIVDVFAVLLVLWLLSQSGRTTSGSTGHQQAAS